MANGGWVVKSYECIETETSAGPQEFLRTLRSCDSVLERKLRRQGGLDHQAARSRVASWEAITIFQKRDKGLK